MVRTKNILALGLGLSAAGFIHTSQAATRTWTGNTTPNWNTVDGFDGVPANGDLLVFGVAGTAGTTLNNNITGLQVGTTAADSNAITFNAGASAYTINGNTINIGLTSNTQSFVNNSTSNQTFNTAFNLNGGVNANFQAVSGTFTLAGLITGGASNRAYQITGPNTVFFTNAANTFAAATQINNGGILNVASLSDYGAAGSLGNRTAASDTYNGVQGIIFNGGGTLQYTGSTATSTNRDLRIGAAATFDASGTTTAATMSFTAHVQNNIAATAANRTITLTGTNTGNNLFAADLLNNNGANNLVKSGTGTWIYSGNNGATGVSADAAAATAAGTTSTRTTATGTIAVNAGTLIMTGANDIRSGGVTLGTTTVGATLQLQANAANTASGVSSALGSTTGATFTSGSSSTLDLRSDTSVTFSGVGTTGIGGQNGQFNTITYNVDPVTTGTGQTLAFGNANGANTAFTTINVTSANGYTLNLLGGNNVGFNNTVLLNTTTGNLIVGTNSAGQSFYNGSTGGITKTGAGTATITGNVTSQGNVTISAGSFIMNGTTLGDGNGGTTAGAAVGGSYTVATGATLGGAGILSLAATKIVTVNGNISPGTAGPGLLTFTSAAAGGTTQGTATLNLAAGSAFMLQLNGTTAGTGYDQIRLNGTTATLALNGTLTGTLGYIPAIGDSFIVVNNLTNGTTTGNFTNAPVGGTYSIGSTIFNVTNGDGNDIVLTVAAVPEPGTWAAVAGGIGLLFFIQRRRQSTI